jgi:hypothetical protein
MTMPTESVRPSIDGALSVMPAASIAAKVEMIEVGMAMAEMMVARRFCMKSRTTSDARIEPMIKCSRIV